MKREWVDWIVAGSLLLLIAPNQVGEARTDDTPQMVANEVSSTTSAPDKASQTSTNNRFALIVGIDDFAPYLIDSENRRDTYDLKACKNDAKAIKSLLVNKYGFKDDAEHIIVLDDAKATKSIISQTFKSHLVENARKFPGGTFVFHYSGHGCSNVPDPTEPDGKAEAILGSDLQPILDDEIGSLCKELTDNTDANTANITLIFDCCNSGTITRATGLQYREVSADKLRLPMTPKQPMKNRDMSESQEKSRRFLQPSSRYTAISACTSDQKEPETTEKDFSQRNGVLTRYLTKILMDASNKMTYRDLRTHLVAEVSSDFGTIPQIDGDLDRVVFSGATTRVAPYISVNNVTEKIVAINAGAAHGIKLGTVMAIYDEKATEFSGKNDLLGQGIIIDTRSTDSLIEMNYAINVERLKKGRVVVVTPGEGSSPLHVAVLQTDAIRGSELNKFNNQLITMLKEEPSLLVSTAASQEDLQSAEEWEIAVMTDTYSNFLKSANNSVARETEQPALDSSVFYLTLHNGQPLYDFFVTAQDPRLSEKIKAALKKTIRQRAVLALSNNTESPLNNAFQISIDKLEGYLENGKFTESNRQQLDLIDGVSPIFYPGERYVLKVKNILESPVFLNILAIATDGKVIPVWPHSPNEEALAPGRSIEVGPVSATLPTGIDSYKLVATNVSADFSFLRQDSIVRDSSKTENLRTIKSGLAQLLFRSATKTRDETRLSSPPPDPDEWGVQLFQSQVIAP